MFVSLVYTEKGGCWLTATPEILLEGKAGNWRTIALAGTVRLEGEQLSGGGGDRQLVYQEYSGATLRGYLYRRMSGTVYV